MLRPSFISRVWMNCLLIEPVRRMCIGIGINRVSVVTHITVVPILQRFSSPTARKPIIMCKRSRAEEAFSKGTFDSLFNIATRTMGRIDLELLVYWSKWSFLGRG